jgi:hypothetical protein
MIPPGATISGDEACRHTYRFDSSVDARPPDSTIRSTALLSQLRMTCRRGEVGRRFAAVLVKIDHNDLCWRVELRGQQRREADWAGPMMTMIEPGKLAVEHAAAFKSVGMSPPMLLKMVQSYKIDPTRLITHHFKHDRCVPGSAHRPKAGALKVIVEG